MAHALSNIIRQVGNDAKTSAPSEKIVKIDTRTRKALKSKFIWREPTSYLVDSSAIEECNIPILKLEDFTSGCSIRINISYRASCPRGNEERLAEALFDEHSHPGAALENLIRTWIEEEGKGGLESFLNDYLHDRTKLPERLREKAYREVGLNLQLRLQVEEETHLRTIDLGPIDLQVRVTDHPVEQKLTLARVPLEVNDRNRTLAILHSAKNHLLEPLVKGAVQDYFARHISLQEFHTRLQTEGLKQELARRLNEVVSPAGRLIKTIFLDNKVADQPPPPARLNRIVSCRLQNSNITIEIGNNVHLSLNNLAKYRESGSRDPGRWLEESFQRIVKEELQYASYVALLVNFTPWEEKIRLRMEGAARNIGYEIRQAISLVDKSPGEVHSTRHLKQSVLCDVQNYPAPIEINNTVHLSLADQAKYRESGSRDLGEWLEESLKRVIHDVLFDASYIDLLINFRPREEEIKRRLKSEAESIGYEIRQLIAVPDLPPNRWKEGFVIEKEGTFETIRSGVQVKLRVVITARISDLRRVETFLNRQQDVPKLMEEAAIRCLRSYLHRLEPARFYTQFYVSDPMSTEDQTVEKEIIAKIHKELEKFHADIIDIIPKPLETEITERLNQLQERPSPIHIEVKPLGGGESVFFSGRFRVEAVLMDQWHKLQQRKFDLNDIRQSLAQYISSRLNTWTYDELIYVNQDELSKIEFEVKSLARKCAADEFGLDVSISVMARQLTALEQDANDLHIARYRADIKRQKQFLEQSTQGEIEKNEATLEDLRVLWQKRRELIGQSDNELELQDLNERIAKIENQLKPAQTLAIEAGPFKRLMRGNQSPSQNTMRLTNGAERREGEPAPGEVPGDSAQTPAETGLQEPEKKDRERD